jgi:hypothetical protein
VPVLIGLTVAAIIFGALLAAVSAERKLLRRQHWDLQARWLAESALERAAALLHADAGYQGETWRIPADAFCGHGAGSVEIRVEATTAGGRRVQAVARYPSDETLAVQHSREALVNLSPRASSP